MAGEYNAAVVLNTGPPQGYQKAFMKFFSGCHAPFFLGGGGGGGGGKCICMNGEKFLSTATFG